MYQDLSVIFRRVPDVSWWRSKRLTWGCLFLFQMRSIRGGVRRGVGGRHSSFAEFRAIPGASYATPTGEVVAVKTGRVCSFVPTRLLPRISWANEIEEEERREKEERESTNDKKGIEWREM